MHFCGWNVRKTTADVSAPLRCAQHDKRFYDCWRVTAYSEVTIFVAGTFERQPQMFRLRFAALNMTRDFMIFGE
jgi:hypothetical protein